MFIETMSAEETFEAGVALAKAAKAGEVYALLGDLGVGKTVFTQGTCFFKRHTAKMRYHSSEEKTMGSIVRC